MQGNDLGGEYPKRIAVVLEDTLYKCPESLGARALERLRQWDQLARRFELVDNLCKWIAWHGREFSVGCEVWSMLPQELFDRLMGPVMEVCDGYVLESHCFSSIHLAYTHLQSNRDIITVYDGNLDRVQMYWHMRGSYVETGKTP